MSDLHKMIFDIASSVGRVAAMPKVYSFYIAYRAKKGLSGPDPENIIASVGEMQTVGDCRYAIEVTDHNETRYRVTIEVLP